MKLLAACQTLETLEALEKNRQAETSKRKVIKRVYSDTSPPSCFFHRPISTRIVMLLSATRQPPSSVPLNRAVCPVRFSVDRLGSGRRCANIGSK